jgi:ketosteroid isomerase-like protein
MDVDITRRLSLLRDIEAIERLKHEYWHYNDSGLRGDLVAGLFTEDGVWSNPDFGTYVGRDAIRAFFEAMGKAVPFCSHLGMNPMIEVDGDRATGRWRGLLLASMRGEGGDEAQLTLMDYVDTFERHDGRWLIRKLDIFFNFTVPFGGSWLGQEKSRADQPVA